MAYSRKAAVLPGFYRGKHRRRSGDALFPPQNKTSPLYDRHPCHLLSSIVSFIRNSVCGQLGSSSLLSIEKGRIRLWTRPHLSVILILSVLHMFHFFSLFLPIFGKFQSQTVDSFKRFLFAFQQNIDHFCEIFSFVIPSECFSVLPGRRD